ncbi:AAA family ATPase [Candidatus Contendibacter odensensis]|uniref:Uncharacterized protein n=1 Tax=Candidatus Contendobacter odensis Run_B_J11 TaxID=1400861 RepID=A0A7U7GDU6_9GAMM|nr:AAA family ATPase [Candidatus Contendobacter odensis]CDH46571.1 hypothetical protein BN874_520012 [Candidatus Contendobacter odensis Run_B_J11]
MAMMTPTQSEVRQMNEHLLEYAREALPYWLPHGYFDHGNYRAKNLNNIRRGNIAVQWAKGSWSDSADKDAKGPDLLSLHAHLFFHGSLEASIQQLKQEYQSKTGPFKPRVVREPNFSTKPEGPKSLNSYDRLITPIPKEASLPEQIKQYPYWIYRDPNGRNLFYVVRVDRSNYYALTYWITPRSKYEWRRQPPSPLPLYHWDQLSARETILVTQGEESADAAAQLFSGVATTSFDGLRGVDRTDWTPLKEKKVVIWPRHNEAGERYKDAVISLLWGQADDIQILQFTEHHPVGWDAAAALNEGWKPVFGVNYSLEYPKLFNLARLSERALTEERDFFETCGRSLTELIQVDLPPLEYVVQELITTDSLNLVSAWRGVGKSLFVMELAIAISTAKPFFVWEVPKRRTTVVIDGEMGLALLRNNYESRYPQGRKNLYLVASDDFVNADHLLNIVDTQQFPLSLFRPTF